jgi:cytochrome b subunit of formate dehydrogenase
MLRLVFAIPGLALTAAILWAFGKADFWSSVAAVTANPWGLVTLIDLYAGFIITGMIIAAIERWKPWAFAMLALSLVLGNVVYAAWAVVRGAAELRRLALR